MSGEHEDSVCLCTLMEEVASLVAGKMYPLGAFEQEDISMAMARAFGRIVNKESSDTFNVDLGIIVLTTLTNWQMAGRSMCEIAEKALSAMGDEVIVTVAKVNNDG